jgi:CheY-like chemotaxis protein
MKEKSGTSDKSSSTEADFLATSSKDGGPDPTASISFSGVYQPIFRAPNHPMSVTSQRPQESPRPPLLNLQILVVDDDDDSRDAVALLLEQNGAGVCSASSVVQALEQVERNTPDVMLSDIAMAGADGYVLIRKIRERELGGDRRIHAIAVSGYVSAEDRTRAIQEGYDLYLPKPVHPQKLLDLLGSVECRKDIRPSE